MTSRQQQILRLIHKGISQFDESPSIRELVELTGIASTSTVAYHIGQLEKDGFITKKQNGPRSIRITPIGYDALGIDPDGHRILRLISELEWLSEYLPESPTEFLIQELSSFIEEKREYE